MYKEIFNSKKKWLMFLIMAMFISSVSFAQDFYLFIGTYSGTGSKGIYVYNFNTVTGETRWVSNTDSVASPSYVTISGNYVFAVNTTKGTNPGRVSSFLFDKENEELHFLNTQFTGGDNPCHLAVSPDGKWLSVANYGGGSLSIFPINLDGSLQPYSQLIQHTGSSINIKRQKQAHVHETVFSPDNKYLFVPDLGMDKVMIYNFNPLNKIPLSASLQPYVTTTPGSGPRHIAFSPNKRFLYLINELNGMVTVYNYNNGRLSEVQNIPTYPDEFKGIVDGSEICVSFDGKFLYTSQRGDENLISIFSICEQNGKLKLKGHHSTFGKSPRNFIIDPTGNYLLVANQNSDNIVIFKRDKKTGLLKETGIEIKVPKPACLQMVPVK